MSRRHRMLRTKRGVRAVTPASATGQVHGSACPQGQYRKCRIASMFRAAESRKDVLKASQMWNEPPDKVLSRGNRHESVMAHKSIYVVDDDPSTLKGIGRLLRVLGF